MKQLLKTLRVIAIAAYIIFGLWLCSRPLAIFGILWGLVGFIVFFAAYLLSGWALIKAFKYGANL